MALDPTLAAEIEASVAEGFADQVAHTQALVRFASLRGEEPPEGVYDIRVGRRVERPASR